MSKQKSLAARLADLTSAAPSETFNPDQPDFDDGTGAGLSRYDDEEEVHDAHDISGKGPSAGLRVAADMEMIGQEYHGKRVSRKKLEASSGAFGDARDPEGFEGDGGSSDDDDNDDNDGEGGGGSSGGRGKAASSSSMATKMNLDDVSSSDDDDEDDDDNDNDDMDEEEEGEGYGGKGRGGGKSSRQREEEAGGKGGGGGGGSAKRQRQSNVFAGVKGEDVDAIVDEQIMQLDRQDEKARKSGRGVAGEAEMKRAKEVLRQREWWDSMLEIRILLQRVMNAANQLPGPDELPLYLEGDASLTALAKEGADAAQGLATQLSAVRRCHMGCWGISNSISNVNAGGGDDDGAASGNNETVAGAAAAAAAAIMAPDDDGHGDVDDDNDDDGGGGEATAAREHKACMGWWSDVCGRWHQKTQLVDPSLQKKFKVVNQGPWAQVTASLADKQRSNRRSFMAVSETEEFLGRKLAKLRKQATEGDGDGDAAAAGGGSGAREGKRGRDEEKEEEAAVAAEGMGRERRSKEAEPVDLEVIDDRDFYQHLLKEFMDSSGGSGNGYAASAGVPVRRKSRKKAVDRRASKGRKIKYVTHPKMQNFMFPQEYGPPPMEPSELFASLFGGAGNSG